MGTMTITSSGFTVLPTKAATNWPDNITWPDGGSINGTKTYTISDSDAVRLLSWIAENYNAALISGKPGQPPFTVPAIQILVAWLNGFMTATADSVQRQQYIPATPPPPISIT